MEPSISLTSKNQHPPSARPPAAHSDGSGSYLGKGIAFSWKNFKQKSRRLHFSPRLYRLSHRTRRSFRRKPLVPSIGSSTQKRPSPPAWEPLSKASRTCSKVTCRKKSPKPGPKARQLGVCLMFVCFLFVCCFVFLCFCPPRGFCFSPCWFWWPHVHLGTMTGVCSLRLVVFAFSG